MSIKKRIANPSEIKELKAIHNCSLNTREGIHIANPSEIKELKAIHNPSYQRKFAHQIANPSEIKELNCSKAQENHTF